jgi:hypothetical protein
VRPYQDLHGSTATEAPPSAVRPYQDKACADPAPLRHPGPPLLRRHPPPALSPPAAPAAAAAAGSPRQAHGPRPALSARRRRRPPPARRPRPTAPTRPARRRRRRVPVPVRRRRRAAPAGEGWERAAGGAAGRPWLAARRRAGEGKGRVRVVLAAARLPPSLPVLGCRCRHIALRLPPSLSPLGKHLSASYRRPRPGRPCRQGPADAHGRGAGRGSPGRNGWPGTCGTMLLSVCLPLSLYIYIYKYILIFM